MSRQLLFYDHAVPISKQRHAAWGLVLDGDYAFARGVNSVPAMAVEFPAAASEYALVFTGGEDVSMPVVVLGAQQDRNRYVTEEGRWSGRYVPAFVRRYPFVFSSRDEGANFTLCIDETFSGWNRDGQGQRLFDDAGERTPYVESVLRFLKEYQLQFRRTRVFCRHLQELDLLEPMAAQFRDAAGERRSLGGFMAVSREKLKAAPMDRILELMKNDELELIYTHLQSMRHFKGLLATEEETAAKPSGPENAPDSEGTADPRTQ